MSQLQEFLQLVKQDPQLKQQLAQVADKESGIQMAVEYGQKKGFNFTAADVQAFLEEHYESVKDELSEEELEAVAGGSANACNPNQTKKNCPPPSHCGAFSY